MSTAEDVLAFWFGKPATSEDELVAKVQRWFGGDTALDASIQQRFAFDVERALAGELDGWAGSPRGLLALVILLDQFPRSIFRDTPRAFAGDAKALAPTRQALASGAARALDWEGRHFLLMPFLHEEDLAVLEEGVGIFTRTFAEAPALNKSAFAAGLEQAEKYREVVRRFGRFPHRNTILGRVSSAEEVASLEEWARTARPAMARKPAAG